MDTIQAVLERVRSGITQSQSANSQTKIESGPKKICCNICEDVGFIEVETKDGMRYRPCKCREMAKIQKIWEQSGISVNDIDKSFSNFETWNIQIRDMKDKATSYYRQFENIKKERTNSIMLCGNPGCGKTHLALALANNLLKKKQLPVVYMPYRDVITDLKHHMTDEEYYKRTLSKYQNCEVLLIDDLFKGKINETDINIMFELINYRYLNRLPMIISTEFTIEKLLSFDEAIGSRIYEMSKNYVAQIQGSNNNYRLR